MVPVNSSRFPSTPLEGEGSAGEMAEAEAEGDGSTGAMFEVVGGTGRTEAEALSFAKIEIRRWYGLGEVPRRQLTMG
jgi:hypothetical protein